MNADELSSWLRKLRDEPILAPSTETEIQVDPTLLLHLLPHRGVMLLLDAIEAVDLKRRRIRARRRINPHDPILSGHFPGHPVYPGVLLIEMIGQAGLCLLGPKAEQLLANPGAASDATAPVLEPARLTQVYRAIFLKPVAPGDDATIHAQVEETGLLTVVAGQIYCREELRALAVLAVY
jgi:3-hydroxymyristoyl/3-hydroxydecanoyl-(acyl carrier protein) dehydratase